MQSRRLFLKRSMAIAAGIVVFPELIHADRFDNVILGQGDFRYRLNLNWGNLDPSRYPVNDCHEMVQDSKGRIVLLTNETRNNVLIYDKSGQLLESWGTEYPGAHGLTLAKENGTDFLFIADNNRHQVVKTTIDGKVVMVIDYPKETGAYQKPEQFIPTETAIGPNGDIYIADGYGLDYIIQYNYKGEYIRHFGGRGEGAEHLLNAHGVCLDRRDAANPTLLVSSRQQHRFVRYALDGKFIEEIKVPGAWVCRPVVNGQQVYAACLISERFGFDGSGFITILDEQDRVVANLAGSDPTYVNGQLNEVYQTIKVFKFPHDVCVDDEGDLYLAQWNSGKVYPYKLERV